MAFKMKGHALPGINQRGNENLEDGRSKSSAFQKDGITGKIYDSKAEADEAHKNTSWGLDDKKDFHYKVKDPDSPTGVRIKTFTGHKKQMPQPK